MGARGMGVLLLADTHLLVFSLRLLLHVCMVICEGVIISVRKTQEWPEGSEHLVQDLQQGFLPTGEDVVLGQLQEGQTVLTLTPHMKIVSTIHVWTQDIK